MSITLRDGFVEESLDRVLEDLLVRFVINCPPEDLSSIERVLFQIEEAQWFYVDFIREINPSLPQLKMKGFTKLMAEKSPTVWKWGDTANALAQFGKYKSMIPVRGALLLNEKMDKLLMVKGVESKSWSFPRGKISKDEDDVSCAIREVKEETSYDCTDLIDPQQYVERTMNGKNYKIYFIDGVAEDFQFTPMARNEIDKIEWKDIKYLTSKAKSNSSNFFLLSKLMRPILNYISMRKGKVNEELVKIRVASELKQLLGVSEPVAKEAANIDPGRDLLEQLKTAINQKHPDPAAIPQSYPPFLMPPPFPIHGQQMPFMPYFPHQQIPGQFLPPSLPHPSMLPPPPPNYFPPPHPHLVMPPPPESFSKHGFNLFNPRSKEADSKVLLSVLNKKPEESKEQPAQETGFGDPKLVNTSKTNFLMDLFNKNSNVSSSAPKKVTILKREPQQETSQDTKSNWSDLLSLLKREPQSEAINNAPQQEPKSNGSDLLSILKREPETKNGTELLSLLKQKPAEVKSSNGNELLSILKREPEAPKSEGNKILSMLQGIKESDAYGEKLALNDTPDSKPESSGQELLSMLLKSGSQTPVVDPTPVPTKADSESSKTYSNSDEADTSENLEDFEDFEDFEEFEDLHNGGQLPVKNILHYDHSDDEYEFEISDMSEDEASEVDSVEEPQVVKPKVQILKREPEVINPEPVQLSPASLLNQLNGSNPLSSRPENDSASLLSLLKNSSNGATPVSLSKDEPATLLDLIKNKPETAPAKAPESDSQSLLGLLKKPSNDSESLLSLLKKPSEDSKSLLDLVKKPENDSQSLLNLLKKPEDDSHSLLNSLKKPESDSQSLLSLLKKPSENDSQSLLNLVKKPSDESQSLLSLLKRPENGSGPSESLDNDPALLSVNTESPSMKSAQPVSASSSLLSLLQKPSSSPAVSNSSDNLQRKEDQPNRPITILKRENSNNVSGSEYLLNMLRK